jgi:hypothetical protein
MIAVPLCQGKMGLFKDLADFADAQAELHAALGLKPWGQGG